MHMLGDVPGIKSCEENGGADSIQDASKQKKKSLETSWGDTMQHTKCNIKSTISYDQIYLLVHHPVNKSNYLGY